ncbi:ABC transporter permease [Desulfopila aestuarii]|uniref:FtsX-like permease family protein n=1 Tax=Desulfopila aestuarii DSM 18488 TaxID=1121416 RepID=A0A1M7YIN9_9BACT|nr:FtsX-like permease family protein [Desulfopila aestuarii]SHO52480.1 FtsX-like permease family protein [Desulfopila aestuarii DSM 18488]
MRRLVALPMGKSVQMAYQSIKVRFFRSLITTMSLVLAVAFLCYILVGNDLAQALLSTGDPVLGQKLISAGYDVAPGDTSLAATAKQRWIVFLSLLVCVVGIINAQLMSVTERFREIGTLKCLGALDRYIVRLFVLEAAMQGLTGSFAGMLAGILAATFSGTIRFGLDIFGIYPFQEIMISAAWAIATGTGLSLLGVLYPALLAARMQPVEAMRVDQ